ncbi:MAG: WhiB family transcriptional regulator [Actinomycetota bacterium]
MPVDFTDPATLDRHFSGDPAELVDAWVELLEAARRPPWHRRAACRGTDTTIFFTGRGQSIEPARDLCRRCPVRAECQATAVADTSLQGVWGGLTEAERRTVRRGAA